MDLPVMPPIQPMLAKSAAGIPDPAKFDGGLSFEPKWDGFRCLVFKDGDEVELASRNTKLRDCLPDKVVLDGEIFVAMGDRLEFEVLQERIHPAASRIKLLSETTPAQYVAFDLLALGDDDFMSAPFADRRARLVDVLTSPSDVVHVTRTTTDPTLAQDWLAPEDYLGGEVKLDPKRAADAVERVIAKPLGAAYSPNGRTMIKIKQARTVDVVVAGYRLHKNSTPETPLLGSLLLGLYDADGHLAHIGVSASFTAAKRKALIEELKPLEEDIENHPWGEWAQWMIANPDRVPGTGSRWSAGKDLSFTPLRPERVLEVGYDHMEGRRFRHTAQFKRWRPDRDPQSCTYDQLEEVACYDLAQILKPTP